ncbi:MAG: porin [Buchnera aphidicola (Pentalonia nigronervosa)]|uniref:Porin n=1 Tax=Buchnera aphidicola (Pentalonia nigronervosa) TaxID=1309793 RepID=A0A7H1AZY1_9GAMM|nr:MAG: porin [Buchnera aphidicola (Pentalonia nigronervosa)]
MINRKSLAVIIPMLLATSSSTVNALELLNKHGNKLELYGSINPNREASHKASSTKINSHDDNTNAIVGLSGNINITDNLSSYAVVEYGTSFFGPEELINKQQPNTIRLGYAGFKYGSWGSIDYGRNYGIMHDAEKFVQRTPYIHADSLFLDNDNYMLGRNNSLFTYRNDDVFGLIDGLSFAVQYQDQTKNRSESQQNHAGWGASLKYESDLGWAAVGTFFSSQKPQTLSRDKNIKNKLVNAYGLGLKYNNDNLYFAAFYGIANNVQPSQSYINHSLSKLYINKTQNVEAIAEYNFHVGFYPSLSYVRSEGKNSSLNNASDINISLEKEINIATRYELSKNISTYMNYKINLLKKSEFVKINKIPTDNIIGAGIVYKF